MKPPRFLLSATLEAISDMAYIRAISSEIAVQQLADASLDVLHRYLAAYREHGIAGDVGLDDDSIIEQRIGDCR